MPNEECCSASFEQERAYVLDRLAGGRSTFTVHRAFVLSGRLEPGAVRGALRQVTARHEILRTSLGDDPRGLVQVVHDTVEPELDSHDVSGVEAGQHERVDQAARSFVERPFDLGAAPLWRMLLVKTGTERHVAVLCAHPAVADAAAAPASSGVPFTPPGSRPRRRWTRCCRTSPG